jgi:peptidyl-prolyl cis-trans isomerase SurA
LTSNRRGMESRQGRIFTGCIVMAAACLLTTAAAPSRAYAQNVILVVNGEVITGYDIEQRAKFNQLASHKNQPRQEIIEELIDDKLKAQVARRYKIDLTDKDVDGQYADMAKRMHLTADQLTQTLGQSGVDAKTLKAKILADLSWQLIVRGKFQSYFQLSEKSINDSLDKKGEVGYDYTLRPILFLVPKGNAPLLEARHKDAEALRGRFVNCESGLALARSLHDVVILESITRNSSEVSIPALREILNKTELGHLTPPETTEQGVQLFAICDKKETTSETPEKREKREKMISDVFQAKSKSYIRELRRQAMIERKQ